MRLHATALVAISIVLGCASYTPHGALQDAGPGPIVAPQLFNLQSYTLNSGATALLVTFVTRRPLDSIELQEDARAVLLSSLTELVRRGSSHILVVAMPRVPVRGRTEGRLWYACISRFGELYWLDVLDTVANFCAPYVEPSELRALLQK